MYLKVSWAFRAWWTGRTRSGYRSITVPGAVKGLALALERYGRFGLDTVLDPAIQLAQRGLRLRLVHHPSSQPRHGRPRP